jgi:hypothetical protein
MCRYCGVNGGPHHKQKLEFPFIKRVLDEAANIGTVAVVVFTGGEPFVLRKTLYKSVEYAANSGFLTRIVSNAYWATSYERAFEILSHLKRLGLTEINYSCDDFHQEFIPLDRIKWASEAAFDLGIPALVASKGIRNSIINPAYLSSCFGKEMHIFRKGQDNPKNYVMNYGVTVPVGWESDNLTEDDLFWPDNPDCWKAPCRSVLDSIVITPEHEVAVCCGIGSQEIPETRIGSLLEDSLLDLLVRANNDLLVNWLALEGPYGILRHLKSKSPDTKFAARYVSTCHLCHSLFTDPDIVELLEESLEEITPLLSFERAWLEHKRGELSII